MPQPIMNPNYFNPQYRTPMYGQFMPQQEQFQPQQFMQQPQQNTVQMYGRIVPAQECITVTWTEIWGVCTTLKLLHPVCVMQEREEVE